MNKKAFKITSLYDNDDTYYFWRDKTYLERMTTLERLRRITFGYDPSTQRLQRVFTVTQLKKDSARHKDLDDLEHLKKP